MEALAFGGGINSVALTILLVNEGWTGDIVFADTGTEWPETYCYIDFFERYWLKPRGQQIYRLGAEYRDKNTQLSLIEYCENKPAIPLRHQRWCTDRYKIRPLNRWLRSRGLQIFLLAIAAEESHRAQNCERPLVDRRIDRKGCVQIIQNAGLPVPRKSGCYICPFQSKGEWHNLWQKHPDLFERAMRLEESVPSFRGRHSLLYKDQKTTLRQLKFTFESQFTLPFDGDSLRQYQPCICGL